MSMIDKYMYFTVSFHPSQDYQYGGELNSPFLMESVKFYHLTDLILLMDQIMKSCHIPADDSRYRTFRRKHYFLSHELKYRQMTIEKFENYLQESMKDCKENVFQIKVMYRQHYSWQGEIIFEKMNIRKFFRSSLELLHLLYSALESVYC